MVYLEIAPLTIETYLSYDIKDVFLDTSRPLSMISDTV